MAVNEINRDTIEQKVIKVTSEVLNIDEDEISTDSNFQDDLGADSLDTVEIVMEMETRFDIEIRDEDAAKISTIKSAVDYIEEKLNASDVKGKEKSEDKI